MKQTLIDFYLDHISSFTNTIKSTSERYRMSIDDCVVLLQMGKKYHEESVELFKISKQLKDELHANKDKEGC